MRKTLAEFRNLDRRVFVLAGGRMVATWAFSMVLPLMAVYLTKERGLSAVTVGLFMTLAGICGALTQSLAGALCDRAGRVPLLIGASIARSGVLLAMGYAIQVQAPVHDILLLIVANNIARGFFDPPAQALVADLAPESQRVSAFSLQRLGINVGFTAGPAMGALARFLGIPYHQTFFWSLPISVVATVATMLLRDVPATSPTSGRRVGFRALIAHRHDRAFMRFLRATFVFFVLQVQLFVTLPIFGARQLHLSDAQVMTFFFTNGLLVVLLQIPAASFINRIGRRRALVIGCLGYALGYASVGVSVGFVTVLLSVATVTLSEVILSPAQHAHVTSMAPTGKIGAYAGLFGFCQITGQSLGPLVGTTALDQTPPRLAWFILAIFGVAAALWYRASDSAPVTSTNAEAAKTA